MFPHLVAESLETAMQPWISARIVIESAKWGSFRRSCPLVRGRVVYLSGIKTCAKQSYNHTMPMNGFGLTLMRDAFILNVLNVAVALPCLAALNVPLTVQETLYAGGSTGIARTSEPVCMGVPVADSATITTTSRLGL